MRGFVYLLSLIVTVAGAAYFADQGRPVLAVLAVIPGYFVVAYVLILLSTFLPGAEKREFESARAVAFPDALPVTLPSDTVRHPAYLGSMTETTYSGGGRLGWPMGGDLVFRATAHPPQTFTYGAGAFKGFKVEPEAPAFLAEHSIIAPERGPVVMLDGGPEAARVRIWVQPKDAASFADRLRVAGVPDIADVPGDGESST
jgi:hypothetical protein